MSIFAEILERFPSMLWFEPAPAWTAVGVLLPLAIVLVWMTRRSLQALSPERRWTALGLRLAVLLLLLMALAGAQWRQRARQVEVIVLNDLSASARHAAAGASAQETVERWLVAATQHDGSEKQPGDRIGVIGFDTRPQVELLPAEQLDLPARPSRGERNADGTDIGAAIQLGMALFRGDARPRLVLVSDGNANRGDLDAALRAAAARRIPIDVLPLRYAIENDIVVERLAAPAWRREGEPFPLELIVRNLNAAAVSGRVMIEHQGMSVDLDPTAPGMQPTLAVTLRPGLNRLNLTVPAGQSAGIHRFQARFQADDERFNAVVANDAAEAFTVVRGRGSVLWVRGSDADESPVPQLLEREGVIVRAIAADDFPGTLEALHPFDAVVLDNVPRSAGGLDERAAKRLVRYVRDLGGGLVVLGGPDALGAGGWVGSALEDVLPLDCDLPAQQVQPRSALVIVLDRSGSMAGDGGDGRASKQQVANEAAARAIEALGPRDHVGVIAFDQAPTWVVPLSANARAERSADAVRAIAPGGGTEIFPALRAAYDAIVRAGDALDGVRHILLVTDGQSPEPADSHELVEAMRRQRITLSTVAIGPGADARLLERLAREGRGRYYPVTDPSRLVQVFIRESRLLRRPFIEEKPIRPLRTAAADGLWASLDGLPMLSGMVVTCPKPDPAAAVLLQAPGGDPLLAYWQAGLGRAAAFTSDAGQRWASAWLADGSARFWIQLVQAVARPAAPADVEAEVVLHDGRGRIIVDVFGSDGSARSFATVRAVIVRPDEDRPAEASLARVAPGRYEATFEADRPGAYIAALRYTDPRGGGGMLYAGGVVNASAEERELHSNDAVLDQIVTRTGGRMLPAFDPAGARLFAREGVPPVVLVRPLRDMLIGVAVAVLLLDVANRRIAWDWASLTRACAFAAAAVRSHTTVRKVETEALSGLMAAKRRARRKIEGK